MRGTAAHPYEGRPLTRGSLRYAATQELMSLRRSLTLLSLDSSPLSRASTPFTLARIAAYKRNR
jgi:hypothetical protein